MKLRGPSRTLEPHDPAMIQQSHSGAQPNAHQQRQLRVGELLRHALSDILLRGNLRDPDLAGHSITVSEVRVSRDLRTATAYVSLLGGGDMQRVMAGLDRAAPYLSRRVSRVVSVRHIPRFSFIQDPVFEKASRIENLLQRPRVKKDTTGIIVSDSANARKRSTQT